MKLLRKFIHFSPGDQWLLIKSGMLMVSIRLGLWLYPFQDLQRMLETHMRKKFFQAGQSELERVAWSIRAVGKCLPFATCLVQALTAQLLLSRRGHQVALHIGIAKDKQGKLDAHAWIEYQGKVIVGSVDNLSNYTLLTSLTGFSL